MLKILMQQKSLLITQKLLKTFLLSENQNDKRVEFNI